MSKSFFNLLGGDATTTKGYESLDATLTLSARFNELVGAVSLLLADDNNQDQPDFTIPSSSDEKELVLAKAGKILTGNSADLYPINLQNTEPENGESQVADSAQKTSLDDIRKLVEASFNGGHEGPADV